MAAALAAVLVSACGAVAASQRPASGGTVTFAEQPAAPPNYIFPLESGAYFTFANGQFAPQLYLPLYWFGDSGKPVLNNKLSVAEPPVFSSNNTVATVTLKHWQWSSGSPITSRDIVFWMNMLSAVTDPNAPAIGSNSAPGPGWGGSVPGGFPENVVSYSATGTYTITFHLNASYNPTWFLYNELSQIYTVPEQAWDRLQTSGAVGDYDATAEVRKAIDGTTPTQYVPADPGNASSGALGVAQFLNSQAQQLSTYATNPLWKVVDGPFKLARFTTSGFVKLVPNSQYSGHPKPKLSSFEELPFASASAEYDVLRSGGLTIGYIPTQDLSSKQTLLKKGYSYSPWNNFGFNALDFNFTNATTGPIFKQLYFRQLFQDLINQPQYIKDFGEGVGSITTGPVPSYPPHNPDESPLEAKGQVYPYDPKQAVRLLKKNGWTVNPKGVSHCAKPGTAAGECGKGVTRNQQLSFGLLYPSGSPELTGEMEALQSIAKSAAGINLNLKQAPVNQVTGIESAGCTTANPCSDWDMSTEANTGVSWVYLPDYFPTGEEIFVAGAGSDHGDYSSSQAAALIRATYTAPTSSAETKALFAYEDYMARQLPEAWMPAAPYQLTIYKKGLRGLVPQGIFAEIYPQDYSLSS